MADGNQNRTEPPPRALMEAEPLGLSHHAGSSTTPFVSSSPSSFTRLSAVAFSFVSVLEVRRALRLHPRVWLLTARLSFFASIYLEIRLKPHPRTHERTLKPATDDIYRCGCATFWHCQSRSVGYVHARPDSVRCPLSPLSPSNFRLRSRITPTPTPTPAVPSHPCCIRHSSIHPGDPLTENVVVLTPRRSRVLSNISRSFLPSFSLFFPSHYTLLSARPSCSSPYPIF